jgi:hypothetical protein
MWNRYLFHMRNAAQRWFKCHNVGPSPHRRTYHAMASDGTRVFVLGGFSEDAQSDEISLIHVFDTSMYFRSAISSVQPPRLRTQRTSSTRNPSVMLSVLMRRPPNLQGSHPQVPRPRNNHSTEILVIGGPRCFPSAERYPCCIGPPCLPADYSRAKPRSEWSTIGTHGCE